MQGSNAPLRFGIMCNGVSLQEFQLAAVRRLIETQTGRPALLIIDDRPPPQESGSGRFFRRLTAPKLLWRLYRGISEPALYRPVPLTGELQALPVVRCRPQTKGRFSEYFSDAEVAAVKSYELDFILRFAFGIIKGPMLDAARYGVWSFHHGDERRYRGGPPAFWEIFEDSPLTGAVLQRLNDRLDAGVILRRGLIKTINYSYKHNLGLLVNETINWPASAANQILNGLFETDVSSPTNAPVYVAPTNVQMLRYFVRLARNIVRRLYERQTREDWNVGAVRLTPADVLQGAVARNVRWCPPIADGWVADPIAVKNGSAIHVLCERMRLDTHMGYIAALSFDGDSWTKEQQVIDTGRHASYPYVFSVDGQTYCVPETRQNGEVALYRARNFPHEWERVATLLSGLHVVDSTIFEFDGRWWLFCADGEGSNHRLLVFYSESLLGPWLPHAGNPVKTDPSNARPAGPPFWHGGALYRPAQDCSVTYGGRISINRIVELSPSRFEETHVSFLEPDPRAPYGKALHTLSFAGDWAIIDGKRWRWKNSRR